MANSAEVARVQIGLCLIAYDKCGKSKSGKPKVGEPWGERLKDVKVGAGSGVDFSNIDDRQMEEDQNLWAWVLGIDLNGVA